MAATDHSGADHRWSPAGVLASPDARVFLGRLTRLDPSALVRLRPVRPAGPPADDATPPTGAGDDPASGDRAPRVALWARLPWAVLVSREVTAAVPGDLTVAAAELLAGAGAPPRRRDAQWHWPLPPHAGSVVEDVPAARLRQVAEAAAATLREVGRTGVAGRAVGSRVVRDALLDHVPIVVETGETRAEVPQRVVQAVVRMGFVGAPDDPVRVRLAGRWVGLAARYGSAWLPPPPGPLAVRPV